MYFTQICAWIANESQGAIREKHQLPRGPAQPSSSSPSPLAPPGWAGLGSGFGAPAPASRSLVLLRALVLLSPTTLVGHGHSYSNLDAIRDRLAVAAHLSGSGQGSKN
jgi:hypothetical protein